MNAFTALGVSAALTDIMKLQGIVKPTPIQEASIPSIFKGKDVIGRSQTGTGKTLAYLPVIQRVDTEKNTTQVLIMTPTRELSRQIFDVLRPLPSSSISTLLTSSADARSKPAAQAETRSGCHYRHSWPSSRPYQKKKPRSVQCKDSHP